MRGIEYQKDARLGLLLLVSVAFVFAATSCRPASGSDGSEWEFSGDIGAVGDARTDAGRKEGAPIVQGIYSTELVIHRDECRPSLDSIISSDAREWPSRTLGVPIVPTGPDKQADSADGWDVYMPVYQFRVDRVGRLFPNHPGTPQLGLSVSSSGIPDEHPTRRSAFVDTWDMGLETNGDCPTNVATSKWTIRSPSREHIAYKVETMWKQRSESCQFRPLSNTHSNEWHRRTLPRSSCRESYTVRYTLEKECPKERCDIAQETVQTEESREKVRPESNPCQCESE